MTQCQPANYVSSVDCQVTQHALISQRRELEEARAVGAIPHRELTLT